jgi:beta-lactamase superfamily II metal-dependent hydrolase
MSNPAQDVLWPTSSDILLRAAFLYVGQGQSTVLFAASNGTYKVLLIDIHNDKKNGGIDVPRMVKDLLKGKAKSIHAFVNTHPHNDHLCGVSELADCVDIDEVWHSGHNPGKGHKDAYDELQKVIKRVKERGGSETKLEGSRSSRKLGDVDYYVLAPAEYIVDDIADESAETRYQRIHEQCAVLRMGLDPDWIMFTGDADRDAWEKHITDYHKERLPAKVLSAAHHGSRTFFRANEEEDPYRDALEAINPEYVIISAPKQSESPHGHPHDDAVKEYSDYVGDDNVLHTGADRYSYICDIFKNGGYEIEDDGGKLAKSYAADDKDSSDGGSGGDKARKWAPAVFVTRVDERPMGA